MKFSYFTHYLFKQNLLELTAFAVFKSSTLVVLAKYLPFLQLHVAGF